MKVNVLKVVLLDIRLLTPDKCLGLFYPFWQKEEEYFTDIRREGNIWTNIGCHKCVMQSVTKPPATLFGLGLVYNSAATEILGYTLLV